MRITNQEAEKSKAAYRRNMPRQSTDFDVQKGKDNLVSQNDQRLNTEQSTESKKADVRREKANFEDNIRDLSYMELLQRASGGMSNTQN